MRVVVITAPAVHPVTLAEAKAQCRVDTTDDDTLIEAMIAGAASALTPPHGILARSLVTQRLEYAAREWPCDRELTLPFGPVTAIQSVKYYDAANALQTLDTDDYFLDGDALTFIETFSPPCLYRRAGAVRVTYDAGYASAGEVPEAIRQAVLLMVGHLYAHRGEMTADQAAADPTIAALLTPFRY